MTTIPEALDEDTEVMDFVNWDAAAASTGFDLRGAEHQPGVALSPAPDLAEDPSMDLAFGDIEGDDWSYWALQHYESTQLQQDVDMSAPADLDQDQDEVSPGTSQFSWETPEAPCNNCSRWNYHCKRIREGKYRGYCTSCIALRRECSFGPSTDKLASEGGATFPANPWPIMGDRPATSILHEDELASIINPGLLAQQMKTTAEASLLSPRPQHPPKIGARFSRESVKVLKNWVVTHNHHPYPTDEERESLQNITGLNKTQITNWLANARRRGKIQPTRATSPHIGRGYAQAIDIPQRRGTPGPFENMNPLQRWENSPPENEPASVTAIARAVSASGSYSATSGSGRTSPNVWNMSDDGSSRSLCNQSSASSLGTSHSSGGSFASAFSNQSRGSSIPSFVRSNRGRRRRRRAPPKRAEEQVIQPLKTFQCTFCTETFRTKHDWQRHEKSLHLSLERWICSPAGPRTVNHDNGATSCVYCGKANPDEAHIEAHNFSGCTERTLEERTFYRKDHLRQHLRLVHNVRFLPWTMDKWRVTTPAIRSRCGFCGVVLDSWTVRVDHLAEHFKTGNTMADWKGDWGFDAPVLKMVENSIPPYLIHDERQTPLPFQASQRSPATPTNAYELLKMELQWWVSNKIEERGIPPSDAETQQEACRIIYGAEVMLKGVGECSPSWLCDLIMSSEEARRQAAFRPRAPGSNCLSSLRINGKSDIFENCEFEKELQDYVQAKLLLGLTAMDHELQDESCRILGRMEERSSNPSEALANWCIRMINASSSWLEDFRQRAHLPRSEDVGDACKRSTDPKTIDSTIHNYSRLEAELGEYLQLRRAVGDEPTDADLQRQGRIIVYEVDDEWNQTAADDKEWLAHFRERHPAKASRPSPDSGGSLSSGKNASTTKTPTSADLTRAIHASSNSPQASNGQSPSGSSTNSIRPRARFLNDANCFRRLARDLNRFVVATTSANNPNRHVPTDEELQHQARWIVYDDDDPFNQTAADNAEWLQRFKIDAGLSPPGSGPGLGLPSVAWSVKDGGTGFEPPYVTPNPAAMIEPLHGNPHIYLSDEARPFESEARTANHFLQTFTQRYPAPAKIFCSRDLENGLKEYVKRELQKTGVFPSDTQLQARARDIMSMQKTPCDDPILLGKFKAALQANMPMQQSASTGASFALGFPTTLPASLPTASAFSTDLAPSMPALDPTLSDPTLSIPAADTFCAGVDLDLNFTEQELNDILQDVSYELGDSTQLNLSPDSQGNISGGSI